MKDEPGSPKNGKHNCFSCGWGGDAVTFVMHTIGLSLVGANAFITERALRVTHPAVAIRIEIGAPTIRRVCTMPAGVYFEPLSNWVSQAKRYVMQRNITAEQVERWGLGYAVDGQLAGRIVIPTRDVKGKLLNWTARSFLNSPKRYLAAETSDHPDVDAVFGEQHWGDRDVNSILVVVEGAFNAMAVERAYEIHVGALSGSHIEPGHAMKLARFNNVLLITDPDPAGDIAAGKLTAALGRHSTVERLRLNPKEDPDNVPLAYLQERLCESLVRIRAQSAERLSRLAIK